MRKHRCFLDPMDLLRRGHGSTGVGVPGGVPLRGGPYGFPSSCRAALTADIKDFSRAYLFRFSGWQWGARLRLRAYWAFRLGARSRVPAVASKNPRHTGQHANRHSIGKRPPMNESK